MTGQNGWRPLSDGKVASGQAVLDQILGGLTDETLCAANVVNQRAGDSFTRARPEDRKRILAEAAGLRVYDQLTETSRERMRKSEAALSLLGATAAPLRTQVAGIPALEASIEVAVTRLGAIEDAITELERNVLEAADEVERTVARVAAYEQLLSEATALQQRIDALDGELAEWSRKQVIAAQIVAEKARLQKARGYLTAARAEIVTLEAQMVADHAAVEARSLVIRQKEAREERLRTLQNNRAQESRGLDHLIDEAKQKGALIDEAECCAPEPSCVFLADARAALAGIPDLETEVAAHAEPSADEAALIRELLDFVIPNPPKPEITRTALADARARARDLEKDAEVAEKIARAEEVLAQHDAAVKRLREQRADLVKDKTNRNATLLQFGSRPNVDRARQARDVAARAVEDARRDEKEAEKTTGALRGRLAALQESRVELERIESEITTAAVDVAAWTELVLAWRACRVMVLESSVIPQVEQTANEILRRFPHGLQIALTTQREKRDGAIGETLEVEVLGKGGLYEMCSGGERTTIDFASHVALALVVSRRASTRLRILVVDEPEGLDERSRAAFAATIRWVAEELHLRCLVMSHMDDIVDGLGGVRINVLPGVDGSTIEVAA